MEVWVSLAVLSACSVALCLVLASLNRTIQAERKEASEVLHTLAQMENILDSGEACSKNKLTAENVVLEPVLNTNLIWVKVGFFKRLALCR